MCVYIVRTLGTRNGNNLFIFSLNFKLDDIFDYLRAQCNIYNVTWKPRVENIFEKLISNIYVLCIYVL